MSYILLDLNTRDPFISDSNPVMLTDTKVVIQSLWRLITTEEGEIPNFRSYGLNLKQFCQYPLTKNTATEIGNYIEGKIRTYEQRVHILETLLEPDYINESIKVTMTVRVIPTGEVVQLPTWSIKIGMV